MKLHLSLLAGLLGLTCLSALASGSTQASGRISFYGDIVEPTCRTRVHTVAPWVALDCEGRGDAATLSQADLAQISLTYLNAQKTLVISQITYR